MKKNTIPTILVVEDAAPVDIIIGSTVAQAFKAANIPVQVETTDNMETAARIIREQNVAGIILDNNFPLRPGGKALGQVHADKETSLPQEQIHLRRIEGGAGTLLMHFALTGKFGALSESTKKEIAGFASQVEGPPPFPQNKPVPILWNTTKFETGKFNCVKAVAQRQQINPQNPKFEDPSIIPLESGGAIPLGSNVYAMNKPNMDDLDNLHGAVNKLLELYKVQQKETLPANISTLSSRLREALDQKEAVLRDNPQGNDTYAARI